jgi:hypothetical protein
MPNRIIREGIRKSLKVCELPPLTRWLFVCVLTAADDFGRYHADARLVSGDCLPFDGVPPDECARMIDDLQSAGLVQVYESEGRPYLQIRNFDQRVRSKTSKFPDPPPIDGHTSDSCQRDAARARAFGDGDEDGDECGDARAHATRMGAIVSATFDAHFREFAKAWREFCGGAFWHETPTRVEWGALIAEGHEARTIIDAIPYSARTLGNKLRGWQYPNSQTWLKDKGFLDLLTDADVAELRKQNGDDEPTGPAVYD